MLEVLDPSQNDEFVDHYLNLPFDLSAVLFICTANNLFDIPAAASRPNGSHPDRGLHGRGEGRDRVALSPPAPARGARHHRQGHPVHRRGAGFISSRYSREAGLRNFERNLAAIMRKRARRKAEGEEGAWIIDIEKVEEILGAPRYAVEEAEKEPEIGVVTGLAWTATGGDLMLIEALRMPGTGRLTVTGQLGDVMRESVDAAYSYVRSRATPLGIPERVPRQRPAHPLPRRRDPEGRAERGHRGHAGDRERAEPPPGPARRRHDG